MTPQELKASILQLAIQGKLVEQRPEEGSGGELLERIFAAKNAKDAKGAKKSSRAETPRRRGKADAALSREKIPDDEKPFDIPESWEWVRLGEVIDYRMGKTPPRADLQWWSPDIPWVSIADMPENGHVLTTKERVSRSAIENLFGGRVSEAGTLLMSFKLTVGRVSILDIDAVHNEAIISIFPCHDEQGIFKSYLFLILPFVTQFGDSKSAIKGKTLNSKSISNLPIPLPPLAEQKRIVAKIEELLPYIDRYEKAWSKLEDFNKRFPVDMQKSLLQMAIQGKLVEQRAEEGTAAELVEKILAAKNAKGAKKNSRAETQSRREKKSSALSASPREEIPDDEKPFDIPESWEWVRLGEIMLDVSTGPFGSMLHKADYCDGGIPLVNPMNIQEGRIVPSDKMRVSATTAERLSSYRLNEGMVVVARRGELGRCASVGKEQEGWLCGTGSFFLNPSKELFVPFVTLIISSPYARQLFAGKAVGTTMANLNHGLLKALPFPLPPLAEQKRIVAKLEELLPLCERLK